MEETRKIDNPIPLLYKVVFIREDHKKKLTYFIRVVSDLNDGAEGFCDAAKAAMILSEDGWLLHSIAYMSHYYEET